MSTVDSNYSVLISFVQLFNVAAFKGKLNFIEHSVKCFSEWMATAIVTATNKL